MSMPQRVSDGAVTSTGLIGAFVAWVSSHLDIISSVLTVSAQALGVLVAFASLAVLVQRFILNRRALRGDGE